MRYTSYFFHRGVRTTRSFNMEELETFTETKNKDHRFSLDKNEKSYVEDNKHVAERGQWGGRFEFLLAIIGYTVGTGSIWRFPIICAKNGGGAFLIPFLFFLITCGGPLYYLEVCLGQFSGKSAVLAFELCPLFKGKKQIKIKKSNREKMSLIIAYIYLDVSFKYTQR